MSEVNESVESSQPESNEEVLPVEGQESQEEVKQEAVAQKKEEIKAAKRQIQAKVRGETRLIDIDPNDDKELTKYIEKALAADDKFNEASTMRKQVESFIDALRKNPLEVLRNKDLGLDLRALAEKVLMDDLEEAQKSPEQKEQEKLNKELEELKKQLEEEKNNKRNAELEKMREQQFQQLDNEITESLQKSSLPKSPYVVKRIADALIEAVNLGYNDIGVKDIMPFVEEQIQNEIQQMFEAMPSEVLEKLVGKQHLTNMRKSRISQSKAKPALSAIKDTGKKEEVKKEVEQSKDFESVFGRF